MCGKYLKYFISFMVAPIEALFTPSPLAFDGLYDDIIFAICDWICENRPKSHI